MLIRDMRLRAFHAVAVARSFTKAGEALRLSQQAISLYVRQLEEESGTRLFKRGQLETVLTDEGELLFEYATRILSLYAEAEAALAEKCDHGGLLRLAVTNSLVTGGVSEIFGLLRATRPRTSVAVETGHTGYCLDCLERGTVDLAIVSEGLHRPGFYVEPLATDEILLVAATGTPFAAQDPLRLDALDHIPFIGRTQGSGTMAVLEARLQEAGFRPERLNVIMTLGSADAVKSAVLAGEGIGAVSRFAVTGDIKAGTLTVIRAEGLSLTRNFFAVRRDRDRRSRLASQFVSLAIQHFKTRATA